MDSESSDITVFIVEDDSAARESMVALAGALNYKVEAFPSAEEFLSAYSKLQAPPGCLVTDLRLFGMSGVELQQELLRRGIKLPVIVVSGYADVPTTVRAMRMGAVTLLTKPFSGEAFQKAVDEAVRRDLARREKEAKVADVQQRLQQLTPEEKEVMRRLVEGKANKQIAAELQIGLRTVERRRQIILKKMGVSTVVELVRVLLDPTLESGTPLPPTEEKPPSDDQPPEPTA